METKLELRHIAPYLPYELEFKDPETVIPGVMVAICAEMPGLLFYEDKDTIEYFDLSKIKPLLIPLSELTKDDFIIGMGYRDGEFVFIQYLLKAIKQQLDDSSIKLSDYQYLVSNHFDVFNLIPHGLALNKIDFK